MLSFIRRSTSSAPRRFVGMEPLEVRALLSATISGVVMQDITGNGLTADDTALSGVTVNLYQDVNGNGILDAGDGAPIAMQTSAGDGTYSFSGLSKGNYLLQSVPGTNQFRTAPTLSDTIAVNVIKKNGTYGGNVFAHYVNTFNISQLSNISYTINGTTNVTTLLGNVQEGDTVTANFTVNAGQTVTLSLVSYKAIEPFSSATNLQFQTIYQLDSGTFTAGTHALTVEVPHCFFQIDFVGGLAIDKFGPAGSNILYGAQARMISFDNGGTEHCEDDEIVGNAGLTPGFWKTHPELWVGYSPNQTLDSVFNFPSSIPLGHHTMMEALNFGGGKGVTGAARNLLRQAVAAVLNASHTLVHYGMAKSDVISGVNSALASGDASVIEQLKNELDTLNNAGGGIDAHGNPI